MDSSGTGGTPFFSLLMPRSASTAARIRKTPATMSAAAQPGSTSASPMTAALTSTAKKTSAKKAAAASMPAPMPAALSLVVSSSFASWKIGEHTSELQSRQYLVCRLLLEKKKQN